jgi:hypothetical protein
MEPEPEVEPIDVPAVVELTAGGVGALDGLAGPSVRDEPEDGAPASVLDSEDRLASFVVRILRYEAVPSVHCFQELLRSSTRRGVSSGFRMQKEGSS